MMRRVTSLILLLALAFQAGCYSRRPVVVPRSPTDPAAAAIEEAIQIEVTTVTGQRMRLRNPVIEHPYLLGTLMRGEVQNRVPVHLDSIAEVYVVEPDHGMTALAIVGGAVGALAIMALIVALTKDSCPFVYAVTDSGAVLEGELYSGAVVPELERRDFLRLRHVQELDGEYRLILSNESRETQYTDQLQLYVVDHAPGLEVLPDSEGRLHAIRSPVAPTSAVDNFGRDVLPLVSVRGSDPWVPEPYGRDLDDATQLRDRLTLTFPRPAGATEARLVVRIRNTQWADHIVGRYLGLMGDMMDSWYLTGGSGADRGERVMGFLRQQGLTLDVSAQGPTGWRSAGFLYPTGPIGWQDEVLPIPLVGDAETLTVQLEGGALFWMVDYVAVEFGTEEALRVQVLEPLSAVQNDGTDVTALLARSDDRYQVLPEPGHSVELRFAAPLREPGLERSFIIMGEGYYLIHRKQQSAPDFATLAAIQSDPDGFLRFSLREFWRSTAYQPAEPAATAGGR